MGSRVDRGGGRSRYQVILDSNHRVSFMSFLVDRGARGTRYLLGLILRFGPWVGGVPGVEWLWMRVTRVTGAATDRRLRRSRPPPVSKQLTEDSRRGCISKQETENRLKAKQSKAKLNPGGCQLICSLC